MSMKNNLTCILAKRNMNKMEMVFLIILSLLFTRIAFTKYDFFSKYQHFHDN